MCDSQVEEIIINFSDRSVTILSDEGELKRIEWKWDQQHKRPLAIGWAVKDGNSLVKELKGKGLKNIHWVGDELWERLGR